MHARKERIASRGAALLSVVVGEHRTFISDAIDVWCLSDHQATVIDARLHPPDVVAHDEENVWFLRLLRHCWAARRHRCGEHSNKTEPGFSTSGHIRGLLVLRYWNCAPRPPTAGSRSDRAPRAEYF